MSGSNATDGLQLVLPASVPGRIQLARMVRELEALENGLEMQKARNKENKDKDDKDAEPKVPAMSRPLADCVELNKVDILDGRVRIQLKRALNAAKDKAPVMHVTFATEADPRSLQQLVAYVRKEIHPQALISVGLQPALVGGAYVRTPNRVHDFSLKARLHDKRSLIVQALADGMEKAQAKAGQVVGGQAATPVKVAQDAQSGVTPSPQPRPTGWPERPGWSERRPVTSVVRQPAQPVVRQAVKPAPLATRTAKDPHAK